VLGALAALYEAQGRNADARPLLDRLLTVRNPGVRRMGHGPVIIQQSRR
jgi:hypothetical protein